MSDIKLTYFNARGRAETARLILAHAGNMMSPDPGGTHDDIVTRGEVHRPETDL